MADSFYPPEGVQGAARRGLELQRRTSAGVEKGVQRATNLANGRPLSLASVQKMDAFYKQATDTFRPDHRESNGDPDAATITWLLWGGNAGRNWVSSVLDKQADDSAHRIDVKVEKVDSELGIVFGYAIVCKVDGEDYFDTQGDHIPESTMLEATADYMAGDRMAKVMHRGGDAGQVVYGFPVTEDIAKALGIEVRKTGFVVGMRPDDEEVLAKYASGEFTGFSIGGRRVSEEVVE